MLITRFLVVLLAALLLTAPGCGRDASFQRKEASPLSFDVVVLGDTLGALVCALEAVDKGAAVAILYGQPGHDAWLLEQGAVAAFPAQVNGNSGAGKDMVPETYSVFDLRRDLGLSGGIWGQTWHYDLLAAGAGDALDWFTALTGTPAEQIRPGFFQLPHLFYDRAYTGLAHAAGKHGVRFVGEAEVDELEHATGDSCFMFRVRFPGDRVVRIIARAVVMAQGGYLEDRVLMQEVAAGVRVAPWRNAGSGEAMRLAIAQNLDLVQLDHFAYGLAMQEDGNWVRARYPEQALLVTGGQAQPVYGITEAAILAALLQQGQDGAGWLVVAESRLAKTEKDSLNWLRYTGIDSFLEAQFPDSLPLSRPLFDRPWDNYYAIPVAALAEYCLGGIAVNEQGQVLRAGHAVTGMFALGEAAGGLHGKALLPGAALSEVLVWGRRIGDGAARLAQK